MVEVNGDYAKIIFKSNYKIQDKGFKITLSTVPCKCNKFYVLAAFSILSIYYNAVIVNI